MQPQFWRGRRVFVTGHTGFKGGWLCLWLQHLGAEVTGFALPPHTEPSLFECGAVAAGMKSITGDVRDLDAIERACRSSEAEVVFHLAAQSLVRPSYADPVGTYATNVMGTVHLLEAVRRTPTVRATVIVTSDKCYENRETLWAYRETEPMGGYDPYSSSKGCAELVTAAYRRSFFSEGSAVASARAGNVIGGGDWATDRLVPDIMRAVEKGKAVRIRNPGAVRPWQHVLDPVAGYLLLAERLCDKAADFAGGWNFGPPDSDARTVADVVARIVDVWGEGARWEADAGAHPHEAHLLRLDSSKSRALLGWQPRLSLAAALTWTVEWYRAAGAGTDMREFSRKQIVQFQEAATS